MELYIAFSTFIFVVLTTVTIYSIFMKTVPRMKEVKPDKYEEKIRNAVQYSTRVPEEKNLEQLKGRLRNNIAVPTITVTFDVFAVIGYINMLKNDDISFAYMIAALVTAGLLSSICIGKSIKKGKVLKNGENFIMTPGVILEYTGISVPTGTGSKSIKAYRALVGFINSDGRPVVVRDTLPENIFNNAVQNRHCMVALYKGKPATVISE